MNDLATAFHEIMVRWHDPDVGTVRVWIQSEGAQPSDVERADAKAMLRSLADSGGWDNLPKLAERIALCLGANACEVVDRNGDGDVYYTSWP